MGHLASGCIKWRTGSFLNGLTVLLRCYLWKSPQWAGRDWIWML